MGRDEERTVMALVFAAVVITSGILIYTILTLPPREGVPAISVLNHEMIAISPIQANNATQFHFYVSVENYLGRTGYFLVDVWKGEILGDTNPPLNTCIHWGNFSRIILDETQYIFRVNDTIFTSQPAEQYIYYCILYIYDRSTGDFKYVSNALGEMTMVWMQVNVTG